MSLTIQCKYKYFDSTVQRAEDRRQKFYFFRLPFDVNVKLNLSIMTEKATKARALKMNAKLACSQPIAIKFFMQSCSEAFNDA